MLLLRISDHVRVKEKRRQPSVSSISDIAQIPGIEVDLTLNAIYFDERHEVRKIGCVRPSRNNEEQLRLIRNEPK